MPRPISVTIHTSAMKNNLAVVRSRSAGRKVWAVVKANAYGHGIDNAVQAFEDADGLATIEVRDAMFMRHLGWKKRILLLEGFFDDDDLEALERYDIETNVHSQRMIDMIRAKAPYKNLRVHIKVNSGMNRLGFAPDEVPAVREALEAIPGCRVMGVVTHFANSERDYDREGNRPVTVARQLERMAGQETTEGACLANSGAICFHPEVMGDEIRAGIILYGSSPDSSVTNEELGIKPAMTFAARIIAVQNIAPGEAVGYGSRWIASRPSRIAVVACGYADGYPRSMPDGSPTYVEGVMAPLVGSVSMDMLEIDVTDIPAAQVGSLVELWGEHVLVNTLAARCNTIGYELMCALAPRVPVRVD